MKKEILKVRNCIVAAKRVAKESNQEGDKFEDEVIDDLISRLDVLKEKITKKLSEQPTSVD
ncbi:MAG: hypothetical protein AAGJ18_09935 [Bacteroidota bacterium]